MFHCFQCGSAPFATTNQNKYTCTACGFTMYLNASGAVAVLIHDTNHNYLWTIRGREPYKGALDTAGGFIDPDETAEQAARRECLEELGIVLGPLQYKGTFPGQYERCELTRPIINIVYETIISDTQKASLTFDDEIAGVEWHSLQELPKDRLAKNIQGIQPLLFPSSRDKQ